MEEAGPCDRQMVDYGALSLKQAHSPPTLPTPSPRAVSSTTVISPQAIPASVDSASVKVRTPKPCMERDKGVKGMAIFATSLLAKEVLCST